MKRSRGWRHDVALILVGAVIAGAFVTPAGAHVTSEIGHLWKKHIKPLAAKSFYTKKKANKRFLTKKGKAANADKIDGLDSTALQKDCTDGAFLASGFVDESAVAGTFGTAGLLDVYSCLGAVEVRTTGTGLFDLKFANATDTDGTFGTTRTPRLLATARGATDVVVANYANPELEAGDTDFILSHVRLIDISAGTAADSDFTFMVTDLNCSGIICTIVF